MFCAFVGADAHIGPNPPEAGLIDVNALALPPSGRAMRAPTVRIRTMQREKQHLGRGLQQKQSGSPPFRRFP